MELKFGSRYFCSRYRMMCFLHKKGFKPVEVLPNMHDVNKNVWVYDNSPELEAAIDEYVQQALEWKRTHQ